MQVLAVVAATHPVVVVKGSNGLVYPRGDIAQTLHETIVLAIYDGRAQPLHQGRVAFREQPQRLAHVPAVHVEHRPRPPRSRRAPEQREDTRVRDGQRQTERRSRSPGRRSPSHGCPTRTYSTRTPSCTVIGARAAGPRLLLQLDPHELSRDTCRRRIVVIELHRVLRTP
jgi:hypothetical protein